MLAQECSKYWWSRYVTWSSLIALAFELKFNRGNYKLIENILKDIKMSWRKKKKLSSAAIRQDRSHSISSTIHLPPQSLPSKWPSRSSSGPGWWWNWRTIKKMVICTNLCLSTASLCNPRKLIFDPAKQHCTQLLPSKSHLLFHCEPAIAYIAYSLYSIGGESYCTHRRRIWYSKGIAK